MDSRNTEYRTNPVKAIRDHCKHQCCVGDQESWKECRIESCMLYPFRLGKNPFRKKREMTDEQRQAARERLLQARQAKDLKKVMEQPQPQYNRSCATCRFLEIDVKCKGCDDELCNWESEK